MEVLEIKKALHGACAVFVQERIAVARKAMESAQQAANNEEKSTAGDKYDTARAMGHIDRDMNARQLAEALDMLEVLNKVPAHLPMETVAPGALVQTGMGTYFIAVSAGKIEWDKKVFFAVSALSPVAQALLGKKKGDKVLLNGRSLAIESVV